MNPQKQEELQKLQSQTDRVVSSIQSTNYSRKGKVYRVTDNGYDVIMLSSDGELSDLNIGNKYGTDKPAYLLATGIQSGTALSVDEIITVNFPNALSGYSGRVLQTGGAFDVLPISVTDAYVVSGGGGGSTCSISVNNFGVLL